MAEWNSITGISMKTVSSSKRGESEQSSANSDAAERRDGAVSLTPRFSGVRGDGDCVRTVSTVCLRARASETVKTVESSLRLSITPLKRGVNENRAAKLQQFQRRGAVRVALVLVMASLFLFSASHAAPVQGWLSWRGPQQNGTSL